jgi:hypothetical protein
MGDRSPKSKQRDQKQKDDAKAKVQNNKKASVAPEVKSTAGGKKK